eukprot:4415889-Prymnesium_polylepis.1
MQASNEMRDRQTRCSPSRDIGRAQLRQAFQHGARLPLAVHGPAPVAPASPQPIILQDDAVAARVELPDSPPSRTVRRKELRLVNGQLLIPPRPGAARIVARIRVVLTRQLVHKQFLALKKAEQKLLVSAVATQLQRFLAAP